MLLIPNVKLKLPLALRRTTSNASQRVLALDGAAKISHHCSGQEAVVLPFALPDP
jgi:hypothetical protein